MIGGVFVDVLMCVVMCDVQFDLLFVEVSGVVDFVKIVQIGLLNGVFWLMLVFVVVDVFVWCDMLVDLLVGVMVQCQFDGVGVIVVIKFDFVVFEWCDVVFDDVCVYVLIDIVVVV